MNELGLRMDGMRSGKISKVYLDDGIWAVEFVHINCFLFYTEHGVA